MDKNQGDGFIFNGAFYDLTAGDSSTIYSSRKEVNGVNNLVLAIQVDELKYFFLEVSHGVVEVVCATMYIKV